MKNRPRKMPKKVKKAKKAKKVKKAKKSKKTKKTKKKAKKKVGRRSVQQIAIDQRASARFKPTDYSFVFLKPEGGDRDMQTMVIDESSGGCSVVFSNSNALAGQVERKSIWNIRLGDRAARRAEVRWVKKLDDQLSNCGFMFLD